MKMLSIMALMGLLSVSSCSHFCKNKGKCCGKDKCAKDKSSCEKKAESCHKKKEEKKL